MDAIWRNSDVTVKDNLAEKLLVHNAELSDNFYGRIVLRNCNIGQYKRKRALWQKEGEATDKTQELFHEILEDGPTATFEMGQWKKRKRKTDSENQSNTPPEQLPSRKKLLPLLVDN